MRSRGIVVFAILSASLTLPALAAGGSRQPPPPPLAQGAEQPALTPEQQADLYYNEGLKWRDKGWKFDRKAAEADNDKKRDKYHEKSIKQFEKAIGSFTEALSLNPGFYQAHSGLGYALRRCGRLEESLAAYDRALALNGAYSEAIEYRAEAYLGLDRLEEAKQAYIDLFAADPPRAGELLQAMQAWIARRQAEPGKVDAATVHEFAAWVDQRLEIAAQTDSLSQLETRDW